MTLNQAHQTHSTTKIALTPKIAIYYNTDVLFIDFGYKYGKHILFTYLIL